MSEDALNRGIERLRLGIKSCIDQKLIEPALILLYSAIDISGWLNNDIASATVQDSFTTWVNNYLLKAKKMDCDAIDLYAARCGYLHTFTPDSRLSTQGKARVLSYVWGQANADFLRRALASEIQKRKTAVVKVEDIYEGWSGGMLLMNEELQKDQNRMARVCGRAKQFFVTFVVRNDGLVAKDV